MPGKGEGGREGLGARPADRALHGRQEARKRRGGGAVPDARQDAGRWGPAGGLENDEARVAGGRGPGFAGNHAPEHPQPHPRRQAVPGPVDG